MGSEEKKGERIEKLLTAGSQITGATVGGTLGFFLGGPAGAAAAGAAGALTGEVLADVSVRVLSKREEVKIGAAATYAFKTIKNRIDKGEELRKDGFFEKKDHTSEAEEIFEGVLLKAKSEHESKKIKYIGQFYGNLAFNSSITPEQANYLLNILEKLTYQQLVMLHTFMPHHSIDLNENVEEFTKEYRENYKKSLEEGIKLTKKIRSGLEEFDQPNQSRVSSSKKYAIMVALFELYQLSLVEKEDKELGVREEPLTKDNIIYSKTYASPLGMELHHLCDLSDINDSEVNKLKETLDPHYFSADDQIRMWEFIKYERK